MAALIHDQRMALITPKTDGFHGQLCPGCHRYRRAQIVQDAPVLNGHIRTGDPEQRIFRTAGEDVEDVHVQGDVFGDLYRVRQLIFAPQVDGLPLLGRRLGLLKGTVAFPLNGKRLHQHIADCAIAFIQ